MNLALRMTKRQMLLLALIFVAFLITVLFVIHTAMPGLWHVITFSPNVVNRWP